MVDIVKMTEERALKECETALSAMVEKYAGGLYKEIVSAGSLDNYEIAVDIEERLSNVLDVLWRLRNGRLKIVMSEEDKNLLTSHKPYDKIKE